jgi:predicted CXXCH cytochrome family protein
MFYEQQSKQRRSSDRARTAVVARCLATLGLIAMVGLVWLLQATPRVEASGPIKDPDAICRNCHEQLYDRYQRTPMAHASGDAVDGLLPGKFVHKTSGVSYKLFARDGQAWLSYERADAAPGREVSGEQQLKYFIGSGNRGRTYLFQHDGFWFESPVNWYSKKEVWDMNPKSLDAREMPFTLPVDSTCLHCHTSGGQASLPGSRNHFAEEPFLHGGITCESCHGDTTAHVAQGGRGPIMKLDSLPGNRKISVCLQCHLEGEIAVNKPGRSLQMFKPGDYLSEDVQFFVHAGEVGSNGRATSQWEALLQSACFRKSDGRLTCTTCHDPHSTPSPAERVGYYRSRCLNCHNEPSFASRHHPDTQDCTTCHMAREKAEDIAHEQVTDHFIQKRPSGQRSAQDHRAETLMAVAGEPVSDRALGLAYAQLALHGDAVATTEARRLLTNAAHEEQAAGKSKTDAALHAQLGYLDLASGDAAGAEREYKAALAVDPTNSVAAGDLAVLYARSRRLDEAVRLWRQVSKDDPGETAAGTNLALAACMLHDRATATAALERVIAFSPDNEKAKGLLAQIQVRPQYCDARR